MPNCRRRVRRPCAAAERPHDSAAHNARASLQIRGARRILPASVRCARRVKTSNPFASMRSSFCQHQEELSPEFKSRGYPGEASKPTLLYPSVIVIVLIGQIFLRLRDHQCKLRDHLGLMQGWESECWCVIGNPILDNEKVNIIIS